MSPIDDIVKDYLESPEGKILNQGDFFLIEDTPIDYISWQDEKGNRIYDDCNIYDPKYNNEFYADWTSNWVLYW